jgi:hypothetical protein
MPTQKEILQLEYDKKQLQFALDGSLIINQKVLDEQTPIDAVINESNYYLCPFCLEKSNKYTIKNKGLICCPNCLVDMRVKTILFVQNCSNQEYAQWVYNYRLSGFFKKINFEKWTKKLKQLGIAYEFWEEYKKLKGEDNAFTDYFETEEDNQEEKLEFNTEETEQIINGLIIKIIGGLNRDRILIDLEQNNIDFKIEFFDYCYNEALLKIDREKDVKNE